MNDGALLLRLLRLLILLTGKTHLIRMLGWHANQGHLDLLNNQWLVPVVRLRLSAPECQNLSVCF